MSYNTDTHAPAIYDVQGYLTLLQSLIEPLAQEYSESNWQLNLTGDETLAVRTAELGEQLASIFANPEHYAVVSDIRSRDIDDDLQRRQYELLYREFQAGQISAEAIKQITQLETELGQIYNNYRAVLDGNSCSDNELAAVLEHSSDPSRCQRAWEASKQIGPLVAPKLLELVSVRNREAHRLGFNDYYSMAIELQELDPEHLADILQQLDDLTRAPYIAYKQQLDKQLSRKFGISVDRLHPGHYGDPFFQSAPAENEEIGKAFEDVRIEEVCSQFYHNIGMDVSDIMARSDLYEREGKCQHAFCTNIDHAQDIRILCNLRGTERWLSTMLHELGHAVYDQYIPASLPFFLREPAHTLSTEAVAELMGRFTKSQGWLSRYSGIDPQQIEHIGPALQRQLRNELLVFTRWVLVMCEFERCLYAHPEADLNQVWWDIVQKYQMISTQRSESDADWATKIHLSIAPAYYQNYILGEMMASQLMAKLRRNGMSDDDIISSSQTGEFLINKLFALGKSKHWDDALEYATGELLNPAYFAEELFNGNTQ